MSWGVTHKVWKCPDCGWIDLFAWGQKEYCKECEKKLNKILFLDIDGPMIPYRCVMMKDQTPVMTLFDPVAVGLLNGLCEEHGWKIVLHSSWVRIHGGKFTYDHCIAQGLKAEHFHEDAWCNENMGWRYARVAEWLKRHPEIETYVMVDDEPYALDKFKEFPQPDGMSQHLVLVNYYDGFLFGTYNDILANETRQKRDQVEQV